MPSTPHTVWYLPVAPGGGRSLARGLFLAVPLSLIAWALVAAAIVLVADAA
jgi:hypothetical protein